MTSIIITLLVVFYRIPLIQILGDKGIGYYSTALVIYLLLMTCTAYGLPKAVSSYLSSFSTKGQYGILYQSVQSVLLFAVLAGGCAAVLMFACAGFVSTYIFHASLSAAVMRCFAPCLMIITLTGALHGVFAGTKAIRLSSVSHILEGVFVSVFSIVGALCFSQLFPAEADEIYSGAYDAAKAVDGNVGTRWCVKSGSPNHWIVVDLQDEYYISES